MKAKDPKRNSRKWQENDNGFQTKERRRRGVTGRWRYLERSMPLKSSSLGEDGRNGLKERKEFRWKEVQGLDLHQRRHSPGASTYVYTVGAVGPCHAE